jgi:colicin import membrane protein
MSENQPNIAVNAPAKKTRKARRTADQILANAVAAAEAKRLKMLEAAQKKATELAEKAAQKEAERQAKEQAKKEEKERLKQEAAVARAAKKAQNEALVGIDQLMNNALPMKPATTRRKARTLNEQMRNLQAKQAEQAQKAEARKAATAARQAERKAAAAAAKAQKAAQEVMVAHAVEEVARSSPLVAAIAASPPKKTRKRITANNIMAKAQANAEARALQMADPTLKKNPRRKTAEQILANAMKKANALRLKQAAPPKPRASRKKKNAQPNNYNPNAENVGWRYF